jgi:predicted nucleotidyltransferase
MKNEIKEYLETLYKLESQISEIANKNFTYKYINTIEIFNKQYDEVVKYSDMNIDFNNPSEYCSGLFDVIDEIQYCKSILESEDKVIETIQSYIDEKDILKVIDDEKANIITKISIKNKLALGHISENELIKIMEECENIMQKWDSKIDLDDPNILNVYRFGSHVYGTNKPNSDEDFIVVVKEYKESDSIDIHYFTENEFQRRLNELDIQMLECYFTPQKFILKEEVKFNLESIDKGLLRKSISTISNGSWVKGEKKLTVMADYEKHIALKSLFHSLRIRDFGIQLATDGEIYNWDKYNYILDDLLHLGTLYEKSELWDKCNQKYGGLYKSLRSEFVSLCPKLDNHKRKVDKLQKLFKKYNIEIRDAKLLEDIINTLGNK